MSPPETPSSPARGKRILIVDDDAIIVDLLAQFLQDAGHTVVTAHDGRSALLRAQEMRPQLVLQDINLPDMDGYALARRLRSEAGPGTLTIAALTGNSRHTDKRLAIEAGIDRQFVKPVGIQELIDFINLI